MIQFSRNPLKVALLIIVVYFFVGFLKPVGVFFGQTPASDLPQLSLGSTDPTYRFLQESISQFHTSRARGTLSPELVIFTYNPPKPSTREQPTDLLAIASRTNLPVETIATLNRIESVSKPLRFPLLVPNQPGLFLAPDPENDLEDLLAQRFSGDGKDLQQIEVWLPRVPNDPWTFLPGERLAPNERLLFYQLYFSIPLRDYRITAPFGIDVNPFGEGTRYHHGIDLAPRTTDLQVRASANGTVMQIGEDPIYGLYVEVRHDSIYTTRYAHLASTAVSPGEEVRTGAVLGIMGNTGLSTGRHLHFEIWKNGVVVDPARFIRALR